MSRPLRGLLWLGVAAGSVAVVRLLGSLPLPEVVGGSWCLFRRLLLPCPGCGMTRAVAALGRGDLAGAWALHPLSWVLTLEAAALWLALGLRWVRSALQAGPAPGPRPLFAPGLEAWALLHGGLFLSLWAGRAATGTLPW